MRGILLAGGSGTRLRPVTHVVSKQLLPVYDKPLIYYPLATLILAGIENILVVTTPRDQALYRHLLGDGKRWGVNLGFAPQASPRGIPEALIIAREFAGRDGVALILGDNLFHGDAFLAKLRRATERNRGATVFASRVADPGRYGVIELDEHGTVRSLEEKPRNPRSSWAATGLYLYDNEALDIAAQLSPSARGELEITDVNRVYLARGELHVECLGPGDAWIDAGTPDALLDAGQFVRTMRSLGMNIGCLDEAAARTAVRTDSEPIRTYVRAP